MELGAAAAAMPMHIVEGHTTKTKMELKWVSRGKTQNQKTTKTPLKPQSKAQTQKPQQAKVPVFISTNPSHINPDDLIDLFTACNRSCHRFPNYMDAGGGRFVVEAVDLHKLQVALSHSSVLVSVFCKPNDVIGNSPSSSSNSSSSHGKQHQEKNMAGLGELFQNAVMPVTPFNSQLVGFGRAVSDLGLTASIYDVMVIPSLQGMGIGRMIVKRIIRMLTSRDIYDIAALCSENERSFFKVCGFGDDILGSTAMMYTRSSVSTKPEGNNQMVKRAGRKLLLVPPLSKTIECSKTTKSKSKS